VDSLGGQSTILVQCDTKAENNEGKTPALGDGQARALLEAPPENTLKGKRDRAILATFLHHGLRCEALCGLRVRDLQREFLVQTSQMRL
jgi:integrase